MESTTKPDTTTHQSMFHAVLARLDKAAELFGIKPEIAEILRHPKKEVKVSLPVKMDDGSIKVLRAFVQYILHILGHRKVELDMQWM